MLVAVFLAVVSLVLLGFGLFGAYETRLYTAEQRARAPRLVGLTLAAMLLAGVVGLVGLLAVGSGTMLWLVHGYLAPIVTAIAVLAQAMLYRRLGIDRSPLWAQVTARFERSPSVGP